ncbi:MAG: Arm DNA-binding domain-containing protein [Thermosediminibacteraceae bacterium]|nr:Arm DNA-binding domain-containing protein [Thermosediminibacteraceae bacterium]
MENKCLIEPSEDFINALTGNIQKAFGAIEGQKLVIDINNAKADKPLLSFLRFAKHIFERSGKMRGSIVKKGSKWYIVVDIKDGSGKRKQKWISGFRTKKEA